MSLLNGEYRDTIDIADRGFQYGDGVFETIEVLDGKPLFLDRHLNRLENACKKILIPAPDLALLAKESRQVSAYASHAVLKLIVTRGVGGRGYRQPQQISPTRLLTIHPYPEYQADFQTQGIAALFCQHRLAINPALAGIKHMNRLEQILARAEWQDDSLQEGLMLDNQDHVIEGTMSNLFLVKDGKLYTPSLAECGVAGIVRGLVMEMAERLNICLFEKPLDKNDLFQADEIFVTNSVIGIWPVVRLEKQIFSVGAITRSLQKMFNAMRVAEA